LNADKDIAVRSVIKTSIPLEKLKNRGRKFTSHTGQQGNPHDNPYLTGRCPYRTIIVTIPYAVVVRCITVQGVTIAYLRSRRVNDPDSLCEWFAASLTTHPFIAILRSPTLNERKQNESVCKQLNSLFFISMYNI